LRDDATNKKYQSRNAYQNAVHQQQRRQSDHQLNKMIEAELKSLVNATRKPTIGQKEETDSSTRPGKLEDGQQNPRFQAADEPW